MTKVEQLQTAVKRLAGNLTEEQLQKLTYTTPTGTISYQQALDVPESIIKVSWEPVRAPAPAPVRGPAPVKAPRKMGEK